MDFFTSDWNLNQHKIIEYNNRPFSTLTEMNETIIDNTNRLVCRSDRLFFLGNFIYGPLDDFCYIDMVRKFRQKISCDNIIFLYGNHDRRARKQASFYKLFTNACDYLEVLSGEQSLILSHYPFEVWNRAGSWMLHGHTQGLESSKGLARVDVGIDNVWWYIGKDKPDKEDYRPMKFSEVAQEIHTSLAS